MCCTGLPEAPAPEEAHEAGPPVPEEAREAGPPVSALSGYLEDVLRGEEPPWWPDVALILRVPWTQCTMGSVLPDSRRGAARSGSGEHLVVEMLPAP